MFEDYISSYSQQLFLSLGEKRERYALHEIVSQRVLPPYIQAFIENEISWWTYTAVLRKDFGNHFPIERERAYSAGETLRAYLHSIAECDADEVQELIRMSIELQVNALVRPVFTSTAFLFRNESVKTVYELELRAQALSGSIPFVNEVIKNCSANDTRHPAALSITKDQFVQECSHVFSGYVSTLQPKNLSKAFAPLFELMKHLLGTEHIPIELLIAFADESKHASYQSFFASVETKKFTKHTLHESLHQAMGQSIEIQVDEKSYHDKKSDRTYFADKGIIVPKPRLAITPSMRAGIPTSLELSPIENPGNITHTKMIDELLQREESIEQPLRLIRKSFLGTLPMPIQVQYANAIFDGDLTLFRKMGAAIDKSVGSQAAIMTCKAFAMQYGQPIREAEDPMSGLCALVESFCLQRES